MEMLVGMGTWNYAAPGAPWEQGADLEYLKALLDDWARFDWRKPCSIEDLVARADHAMYRDKGLRD